MTETPTHSSGAAFAPGVLEALEAAHGEDAAGGAAPKAAPAVRFIGDRKRSETIELDWPVECDGVTYRAIVLRRLTAKEVEAFMTSIAERTEGDKVIFPVFRRVEDDAAVPDAVIEALDDDDSDRLNGAVLAFLPRRFGGVPASASIPASGAITAP